MKRALSLTMEFLQENFPTVALSLALAGAVYVLYSRKKSSYRKRAMSFNSEIMISGAFPKHATMAPPVIHAIHFYKKCPKIENVKKSGSRLFEFLRWRCTPQYDLSSKTWQFVDCDHNINDHVDHIEVESESEIWGIIDRLSKDDFSTMAGKPLWKFHVIENKGKGLSAVFCQVHHVIGDGLSLVVAMKKVFDDESGNPMSFDLSSAKTKSALSKASKKYMSLSFVGTLLKSIHKVLTLGMSKFDSDISFNSPNKSSISMSIADNKIVFFPTLRLDFVKKLKNSAGGTVNDVMLSLTTGAIRRYCESRGDTLPTDLQVRALMPFAFPRSDNEMNDPVRSMRNKWSFLSAQLPVCALTPTDRLEQCHTVMEGLKNSVDAFVQLWMQENVLRYAPEFIIHKTAYDSFARHSLVFSNVPGPQKTAYFAGEPIVGLQAMFPNIINQVLIISYNGAIFMNMAVDGSIVKDVPALQKAFMEEAVELARSYNLPHDDKDMLANASPEGEFAVTS